MNSKFQFSVFIFLVTSIAQAQTNYNELDSRFDELINPLNKSNNFSGNVLVQKEGEVIFAKSYGLSSREGNVSHNDQSQFFIASISAMFTATAVMHLVDEGKISLDDNLAKFLPDFPNASEMTIHFLLLERSGIPRIGDQGNVNYSQLTESPQTLDELVGYLRDLKLESTPGSSYKHTRSSYILLAKVIEVVSKKSFGDYLRDEIFTPLGLSNTGHYYYENQIKEIPNIASGYDQAGVAELVPAQQIHWSSKTGHASIYSTANDLVKFANALLEKKFLSASSWEKMTNSSFNNSVGYGIFTNPQGNHRRFNMSGGAPGFSSYFAIYPNEKLVIVMLSNIGIHVPYFTVPSLASIVFDEPYEKLNLVSPPVVDEAQVKDFLGVYQFGKKFYRPNGTVTIDYRDNMLHGDGVPLIPVLGDNGEIVKFINRRFWSRLEFDKDKGKPILKFDSFIGERLK
jgi:CubicO group peptidase (beta-lactamase class C family)